MRTEGPLLMEQFLSDEHIVADGSQVLTYPGVETSGRRYGEMLSW